MKLKKLFAGIVAAAMMLTMGATAFAAETETTYEDATSVSFTKAYKLVGEGKSPAETFNFTVTAVGKEKSSMKTQPTIDGTSVSYVYNEATKETGAKKTATLNLPEYTSVGIYKYLISETTPSPKTAGVEYDTNKILLKVTVIQQGEDLVRVVALRRCTVDAEGKITEGAKLEGDAFTNTYTANVINVSKTVSGNMGDRNIDFNFHVKFNVPEGLSWTPADMFAENAKNATLNSETGAYDFTLNHGEQINFNNIPAGVTYTVSEDDYTDDEYTTKLNNESGREAANVTMTGASASYAFENSKGAVIDTGVILDNAPYIALLTIVAFGAVALVLNKRRRDEE